MFLLNVKIKEYEPNDIVYTEYIQCRNKPLKFKRNSQIHGNYLISKNSFSIIILKYSHIGRNKCGLRGNK